MSGKSKRFIPTLVVVPKIKNEPIMEKLLTEVRNNFSPADYFIIEPEHSLPSARIKAKLIKELRTRRFIFITWLAFESFEDSEIKSFFSSILVKPNVIECNSQGYHQFTLATDSLCPRVDLVVRHLRTHLYYAEHFLEMPLPEPSVTRERLIIGRAVRPFTTNVPRDTVKVNPSLAAKLKDGV